MKPVLAALGGAVLLASALVAASPSALATTGDPSATPTPTETTLSNPGEQAALQRDLHLKPAQVRALLAGEQKNRTTEHTLRATLGKHYGGAWQTKDGHLVVATRPAPRPTS